MFKFIQNFRLSCDTLVRILIQSHWTGILKSKSTNKKKSAVIIGNAPSFKETLSKYGHLLKHYDLIAVNNFALSDYYQQLKPRYYIINAMIIFQPDEEQNETYRLLKRQMLGSLQEKTNWDIELMVPFKAKKSEDFQKLLQANKHIKPLYFNQAPVEGFKRFKRFFFRIGFGIPRPHNVIIPSIMNLIYLKYETIVLIGADHSWLPEISVSEDNMALINQKHFYDEQESKSEPMKDTAIRPRRLHEVLHKFMLTFKGYWEINEFIEGTNIKIYNCSESSFIDAFERKKLDELPLEKIKRESSNELV